MGIISGLRSFRGRFGDHFRVGDHFGVGIISGAVQMPHNSPGTLRIVVMMMVTVKVSVMVVVMMLMMTVLG